MVILSLSVVIATRNRHESLGRFLTSLWLQSAVPKEIIVVDASENGETKELLIRRTEAAPKGTSLQYQRAMETGAAVQRNQAVCACTQPVVGFMDDDIVFEDTCIERLWAGLHSAEDIGGVSAMITNQKYHEPQVITRLVYRLIGGGSGPDYAGRIFGPAINTLPADRQGMPEIVSVQWLNTTCTFYRKQALPDPPFSPHFTGYSMMEDAALSLVVARKWKLVNARTARIFHDTQTGSHKSDLARVARMGVVNRDFVARRVQGIQGFRYWVWLMIWGAFQMIATMIGSLHNPKQWRVLKGSLLGYFDILAGRSLPPF